MDPTPENLAALRRERIERARRMSPEQKLLAGPRLFSVAIECMRAGIRLTHPDADETQICAIIRERLEKKRRREEIAID
jgi:hypothetical protein